MSNYFLTVAILASLEITKALFRMLKGPENKEETAGLTCGILLRAWIIYTSLQQLP